MVFAPKYTKVIPENIPQPLKNEKRWTVWKSVDRGGGKKPGKVPYYNHYNEHTGKYEERLVDLHNPNHQMTFDEAYKMLTAKKSPFSGMQYVLDFNKELEDEDRLIGVDLDNALTPGGDIKPEILEIISMFNSYTEFSPSRTGIRIFCFGRFPLNAGVKNSNFEIYQCDKLLTVTGDRIITAPATINNAQAAIDAFREKYFKEVDQIDESTLPVTDVKFTDDELKKKVKDSEKGLKFDRLQTKGAEPGDDLSGVDYAYCMTLVKYTQDEEQIDRLYRSSALLRDKWDRPDGRDQTGPITYGQRTIRSAIRHRGTDVFTSASEKTALTDIENFNLTIYPYTVTPEGITKTMVSKYDEEKTYEVPVASAPVVIVAIGEIMENPSQCLVKLKIRTVKGRDVYVWKPLDNLLNHADVVKLQKEGLHVKESQVNELIEYFDKFIKSKKDELPLYHVASSCGWKDENTAFILGTSRITREDITEIHHLNPEISGLLACHGNIADWAKSAGQILDYPAVRYKCYLSCVPPLIRPLYFTSYISFQDLPTGNAKTVSNWCAASIWGDPIEQQTGGNSTFMGVQNFIQYIKGLPSFLDETTQNPEAAKKLIYAVGNLTTRRKSTNDNTGGVVNQGTPETVLIMTGEVPIIDEKGRGGQDMRAQPLPEGISEFLDNLESIEIGLRENYGWVSRLYIQKIFQYKDQLKSIYEGFLAGLPPVKGIESNRMKKQYAIAATAGFILEKVFAEILDENGKPYINPADSLEICKRYFEMNVANKPYVTDDIKALKCAYQFYVTNQIYFNENDKNHCDFGWVREAKGTKELLICFDEATLAKYINTELGDSRYEAAIKVWVQKGIPNVRTVPIKDKDGNLQYDKDGNIKVKTIRTTQIKVRGVNTTVIQIPISKFYKYLNISPDEQENHSENKSSDTGEKSDDHGDFKGSSDAPEHSIEESEIKVPKINPSTHPASTASVPMVISSNQDIIIVADSTTDLHSLLMDSL
ncbi:DUF927 domain-containing protein [Methanosarcina sp. UBA411]|jgi:uncharacterized protein (DUF927 family)|uniref:phage NrS-1 polymerase family protein n=1 Tax=Methanosarcina sp. UBA411 TaxID=1915589 RepID=UPI0025CD6B64|nr:DUF927 domain-containing protein [Methanosarcina sp. UBA411]